MQLSAYLAGQSAGWLACWPANKRYRRKQAAAVAAAAAKANGEHLPARWLSLAR